MAAFSYSVDSGMVDTSDSFSDSLVIDMSNDIAMLDDDESQFFTILSDLGTRTATREKIWWLETSYLPDTTTVATCATSIATAIDVATGTGAYFRAGDVVRNITKGDAYLVTATVGTSAVSVSRAIGGTAASAAATGDRLLIVSRSSAQGAALPTSMVADKASNYNYTQIQRDVFEFTETRDAIEQYGGSSASMEEKAKKLVEHRRALNQNCFTGARHLDTSGTGPRGLSGGLLEFVTVNKTNVSGTLTATGLDSHLTDVMQYGSKQKVMFVGPIVARALSGFLRDAWQPNTVGEKRYGAKVDAFINGAFGWTVPVYVCRNWSRIGLGGYAFTVDLGNVNYAPLRGRNTKYLPDRQDKGKDSVAAEYLTEFSMEVRIDESHGILYGITG